MKIEFDTAKAFVIFLVLALHSPMLAADNRTISGAFSGDEAAMAASPSSCDDDAKKFLEAGTIQVSASDTYTVVDAGNDFQFFGPESSIADIVVILYEGSFDSDNPATNRVAVVDVGAGVALNTGTDYVVVVQHWCEEIVGAWAAVIDGPGSVSGAGFASLAYTQGEFLEAGDTAAFGELGVHRYEATDPVILPRGGNFFFADVGPQLNGSFISLWVYQNSFDPDNP
ncbi:MAG: hypothetical protein KJO85_01475, partial [Gammaproteobacteria bacterium]|nr:hypothetical protein [Gammaproteobacteria bacterium]